MFVWFWFVELLFVFVFVFTFSKHSLLSYLLIEYGVGAAEELEKIDL